MKTFTQFIQEEKEQQSSKFQPHEQEFIDGRIDYYMDKINLSADAARKRAIEDLKRKNK